jgi:YbbR domain-containing protein
MRDLLIKDWGWKLFSLFLAAVIWLTVHKIIDPKNTDVTAAGSTFTYDNLPVRVVSASADVHDFRVAPASVKVTVSGPADIMNKLKIGDVHAVVNLSGATLASDLHLPIEISAPANVTITAIEPDSVLVIVPPPPEKKP